MNKNVFIIIPVYNDTHALRQVVTDLLRAYPLSIVVVDDGSATQVADTLADLPVTCLRHRINLGQGAALQTGFSYALSANADIVVTFDADGQHAAEDIPAMLAPLLDNEVDITLGSRFLPGSFSNISFRRRLTVTTGRYINFFMCGILLSDAHNGLRALNRKALSKILITENKMAHASEILFEIKRHGLSYKEVPVRIHYTDYSLQKGQKGLDGLKVLIDIILHKLFR